MNKETLLREFVNGAESGKGSNLKIDGDKLYNYFTVIAVRVKPGVILLNGEKYSQTTTKNQNLLRKMALVMFEGSEYDIKMARSYEELSEENQKKAVLELFAAYENGEDYQKDYENDFYGRLFDFDGNVLV